jgi:hypothetical protein
VAVVALCDVTCLAHVLGNSIPTLPEVAAKLFTGWMTCAIELLATFACIVSQTFINKSAKKGKTEWKVHPTTHARSTRGLFQRAWSFPASVLQVPLSLEITRRGPNGPEPARPRSERSPLGTHPPTRAIAGFAPW